MIIEKLSRLVGVSLAFGIIALSFFPAGAKAEAGSLITAWQFIKDVNISGTPAKGELVKITLDRDVFSNSKEDLGDLRIYTGASEVPYKLTVERGIFNSENIYPVTILNKSYSAEGGYNMFVVDFGQSGFFNSSVNILTSSENFKRTVEISGSNDMSSWNLIKKNGYIYDYTDRAGNFKAQNTSVSYPENVFRYIQVKIFTGGEAPLIIIGAQASKIQRSESQETVFRPQYSIKENSAKQLTEVTIDLGKKGWPTSNIILESPDENFNREVVVYESNDKVDWRMVGQSYIFNYNTPKFIGENLEVGYSETSERYLKLEIYNGDNNSIAISGLFAKTILRSIVFQYGEKNSFYRLYYGNPKANFPQYDLEKFFPYLDTGIYFSAALAAEQINSAYQKETPPLPPLTERIPYLVPGLLILVVAMLGAMVFKFMKKVGADK